MKRPMDTSKDNVAMGIIMPDIELISIITASAIFCANSPAVIGSGVDDIIGSGLKATMINHLLSFNAIDLACSSSSLRSALPAATQQQYSRNPIAAISPINKYATKIPSSQIVL
jgi:hypothetical protein